MTSKGRALVTLFLVKRYVSALLTTKSVVVNSNKPWHHNLAEVIFNELLAENYRGRKSHHTYNILRRPIRGRFGF